MTALCRLHDNASLAKYDLLWRKRPVTGRVRWVALLAVLACAGCGGKSIDDSSNGSGGTGGAASVYTFSTSVDGGAPLRTLTTTQAAQLCADIGVANAGAIQTIFCSSYNQAVAVDDTRTYLEDNAGSSNASLQATCARYLMAGNSDPCPTAQACDATRIAASPAACTATVADVVACINENATISQELLSTTPSCTSVTASSLSRYFNDGGAFDMYAVPSSSASCEALVSCYGISTISGGTL
jgi:hypothetical protein